MKGFIRFFTDKENQIPNDSHPVELDALGLNEEVFWEIESWLKEHPNGKVDFVASNLQ